MSSKENYSVKDAPIVFEERGRYGEIYYVRLGICIGQIYSDRLRAQVIESLNEGAETREELEQRMNRVLRAAQAVWRDRLTHNASVIASGIDYFESGLDAPKGTID